MARLIDADRALEIVRDQGITHPNAYHLTNYATLILREAPTVDAVEVVRCEKCGLESVHFIKSFEVASDDQAIKYWNRRADNG